MLGKVTDFVSVGLLNMQTEWVAGVASANNFTVARARRDLPNRSNIGVLWVNRQATGDLAGPNDYNRTCVLDGRWGIGPNGQVTGFVSRTETPGLDEEDHAYNLLGSYNSELWQLSLGYIEIADNFNPEVGFLRRRRFRNVDAGVAYTFRPKHFWKLQEMRPHGSFNRFWNFEGQMEMSFLHMDYDWEFNDSSMAKTTWNVTGEGVTTPFEIADGVIVPVGVYEHHGGLQLLAAALRAGSGPVQRQRRPLVGEPALRSGPAGQHRAVHRLQRHPGPARHNPLGRGSKPDPQVHPAIRSHRLDPLNDVNRDT